jgi:hypothetical protein
MKKLIAALILFLALSSGAKASTITVTFDDINTNPNGVAGLNHYSGASWYGYYVMDPARYNLQYLPAIVSQSQIAFNGYGLDAAIVFDTPVYLDNAYFTSAYYQPNIISVNVTYGDGSTDSFDNLFTLDPIGVQQQVFFNLENVKSIVFSPDTSRLPFDPQNPAPDDILCWYGMDNLTYSIADPVPEPASMALGLISLTGLLGARRRKSQQA